MSKTPHLDAAIRAACGKTNCNHPICSTKAKSVDDVCSFQALGHLSKTIHALRAAIPKEPSPEGLDAMAEAIFDLLPNRPDRRSDEIALAAYRARPIWKELWDAE